MNRWERAAVVAWMDVRDVREDDVKYLLNVPRPSRMLALYTRQLLLPSPMVYRIQLYRCAVRLHDVRVRPASDLGKL